MSVFLYDRDYNESRHDLRRSQDISGRIVAIEWSPDIVTEVGMQGVVGHGPGVPLATTDDLPNARVEGSWSLRFTIETDDPLPVSS